MGECTQLYEGAMDPALYLDVSKIADANRSDSASDAHRCLNLNLRRCGPMRQFRDAVVPRRDVCFETFFMAGVLSSQSYLQMKTLSAALEQSEEIMQWINVTSRVAKQSSTCASI